MRKILALPSIWLINSIKKFLLVLILLNMISPSWAQDVKAPQGVQIFAQGRIISIEWKAVNQRNVKAYKLYKGTKLDSLIRYKTVNVDDNQQKIMDTVNVGYTYYYALTSMDENGKESPKSDIFSRTIPAEISLTTEPAQINVGETFELLFSFNSEFNQSSLSYANFTISWTSEQVKFVPSANISSNKPGTEESAIVRSTSFAKSVTITLVPKYFGSINTNELLLRLPFIAEKEENVKFYSTQFEAEDNKKQNLVFRSAVLKKSVFRTIISAPKGLKVVSGNKKTMLTWSPIVNSDIEAYIIYRSTGEAQKRKIAEIPIDKMVQPYFVDEFVDNGKRYFYSIAALHKNGYESDTPQRVEALPDLPYSYNLVAYYPFNQNYDDESWNGRVAENLYSSFTNDRFGRKSAISLNGNGIGVQIQHDKVFNLFNDFTLSFWINPDSVHAFRGLFSKISSDGFSGWSISLLNGIPLFQIVRENGESYNAMGFLKLNPNEWQHLVYVFSSEEKKLQLYINGDYQYDEWLSIPEINSNFASLLIGSETQEKNRKTHYYGSLDDIRFYDLALSQFEVEGLYAVESAPKKPQEVMVAPGMNQIKIHWKANSETDFKRYRLYMGSTPDSLEYVYSTQKGIKKDTSLVLTGLIEDEPYYFQIAAEDNNGNVSQFSELLEASPIDTGFLLINGLKHYWNFDESIGAYAFDQYGFSPIKASSRRFFNSKTKGIKKNCADFRLHKNYIDLRGLEPLENSWTFSLWIKWDNFDHNETILKLNNSIVDQFSLIRGFQGGQVEWYHNEMIRKTLIAKPEKNK